MGAFAPSTARFLLGMGMMEAQGEITSAEARFMVGVVPDLMYRFTIGGNLSFNGGLSRGVSRSVGGTLTPTGALIKKMWQGVGGNLTFNGTLAHVPIFLQSVGGELLFHGLLSGYNPDWLLIPDYLNWCGEWAVGTTYDVGDCVLYYETDRHFAYASKAAGNTGNTPGASTTWWYRVQQEPWRKV